MNDKLSILRLTALAAALSLSSLAQAAVSLTVTPGAAAALPPSSRTVTISALNTVVGSAIGGFEIDLAYDASIWSPAGVSFSYSLGDASSFQAISGFDTSTPGLLKLYEISLITAYDPQPLSAIQPTAGTAFTLATIAFNGVSAGTGEFRIVSSQLTDAFGVAISPVPEPTSWALLGVGLAAVTWRASRRRSETAST